MFYPGFYFDPTMLIVVPGLILAMWAQYRVQSTFARYSKVTAQSGMTAAQVAGDMLLQSGITDIQIQRIDGSLTDNYNPKTGVLSLSSTVFDSTSLSALGVAAHEVGHVLQHYDGYAPLRLRSAFVPLAQLGSFAAFPLFILGLILAVEPLMWVGIIVFMLVVLFYLVTLPVEYNASGRAVMALESGGYLTREETLEARKVLNAAGWTYIAAALQAFLQLLRLLVLAGGNRNRRR